MVKVCEKEYPKGTKSYQKSDGFYMHPILKAQIDILLKNIKNDWDFTIIITGGGEVRVGKSVLAMQIGAYWTSEIKRLYGKICPWNLKSNFVFQGEKLIKQGNELGINHPYSVLIFDEAHKIVAYSWHKAYSPMVSSTNGTIISYGIAWTAKLSFYNQIKINKKEGLHSRLTYNEAQKYSENYTKWVKKELTRISPDSIEFQLNFALIWHLKTGNPVTPELWDNIDMLGDYMPGETTSDNLYVGIDWGKTTTNTFVTIIEKTLECLKYVDLLELHGDDYPVQHIEIQKFLNKYPRLKKIWSESTGVGDTNTDFLKAIFGEKVIPVTAFNLPSLHDKLLNEIKYKRLIRPRIKEFDAWVSLTRQFLNCEKIYSGTSFKLTGPTDELDDAIDSSSLAVGAALTDVLYDFVYKKSSTLAMTQRVNFTPSKRIVTQSKLFKNKSKYQEHLSKY